MEGVGGKEKRKGVMIIEGRGRTTTESLEVHGEKRGRDRGRPRKKKGENLDEKKGVASGREEGGVIPLTA